MTRILLTGMSGTGKSSALNELAVRGHRTVDTDKDEWSEWITQPNGEPDWIWREDAIRSLLTEHRDGTLFVAGCKSNQGRFYSLFDHVVLLSAPYEVIATRISRRTNNLYGKSPEEDQQIREYLETVEPLLRASSTVEVDASEPLLEIVRQLETLASASLNVFDAPRD